MLPQSGVKVVLGTGSVGDASDPIVGFSTPESTQELFNLFRKYGGDEIDSARTYSPNAHGTSEPIIGKTDIKDWAKISTKVESAPGEHTKAGIEKSIADSLEALQIPSLYIEYLHFPDPKTPFEETIATMDKAYRAGKFKHFGISNFSVAQVREVLAICEEKGYNKPTVYQGQYNAIARKAEDELLPLLRRNNIKFYAWSPAAMGAFSGKSQRFEGTDTLSRIMQNAYNKPQVRDALKQIHEHADKAGIRGHAVALRWALHHSALKGEYGDAIVIGARTLDQMQSSAEILGAGLLPEDIVELVDGVWEGIADVGPGFQPSFE